MRATTKLDSSTGCRGRGRGPKDFVFAKCILRRMEKFLNNSLLGNLFNLVKFGLIINISLKEVMSGDSKTLITF